jgi:hypothetical protein
MKMEMISQLSGRRLNVEFDHSRVETFERTDGRTDRQTDRHDLPHVHSVHAPNGK